MEVTGSNINISRKAPKHNKCKKILDKQNGVIYINSEIAIILFICSCKSNSMED